MGVGSSTRDYVTERHGENWDKFWEEHFAHVTPDSELLLYHCENKYLKCSASSITTSLHDNVRKWLLGTSFHSSIANKILDIIVGMISEVFEEQFYTMKTKELKTSKRFHRLDADGTEVLVFCVMDYNVKYDRGSLTEGTHFNYSAAEMMFFYSVTFKLYRTKEDRTMAIDYMDSNHEKPPLE